MRIYKNLVIIDDKKDLFKIRDKLKIRIMVTDEHTPLKKYEHIILFFRNLDRNFTEDQLVSTEEKDRKIIEDIDHSYIPNRKPIAQAILFYNGFYVDTRVRSMVNINWKVTLQKVMEAIEELPKLIREIDFDYESTSEDDNNEEEYKDEEE